MKRSSSWRGQPASRSRSASWARATRSLLAQGGMAAAEQRLGLEIERAQELALPAGPHARARRRGCRPRSAAAASFRRSRLCTMAAKSRMVFGIVQIAALGEQAHRQMMLDQPGRRLGLGRGQPEARPSSRAMRAPAIGMVLLAALGDVVQEGGDVKRAAVVDGAHDLGRDRVLGRMLARARCPTGSRRCGSGARPP